MVRTAIDLGRREFVNPQSSVSAHGVAQRQGAARFSVLMGDFDPNYRRWFDHQNRASSPRYISLDGVLGYPPMEWQCR
jgi:hypothetical protein